MASRRAPGALRAVQEFVNTVDLEGGTDELRDSKSAAAWLTSAGLLAGPARLTEPQRRALVEVREAIRNLLLANAGEPLDPTAVEVLDEAGRRAHVRVRIGPEGTARLVPAGAGADGVVATLLAAVAGAMHDGTWPRLKACGEDVCRWAFYDHSRNRSGTWCSMEVCGNRAKARAFRRRRTGGA